VERVERPRHGSPPAQSPRRHGYRELSASGAGGALTVSKYLATMNTVPPNRFKDGEGNKCRKNERFNFRAGCA